MQSFFLYFDHCFLKTHKKATRRSRNSYQRYTQLTMTTSISIFSSQASLPTQQKSKGRGNNIVVGAVVKSKIGELEEEVRAGNSRRASKELTGVVQGVLGKRRFLVRFQDTCKNNLSSNPLISVIVEKIPVDEETEVSTIPEIP